MTNQRDLFEVEYISRHLNQDPFREAKESVENLRNGDTYDDEGLASAFERWIKGMDW